LQVLGTPLLKDIDGQILRNQDGSIIPGSVYFTSWLDESIGFDTYAPTTTPSPGNWGGISLQRSVDAGAGRADLEDEGIFLRYVNHADIRYGGGTLVLDSIPTIVNSIQLLDTRATITDNVIRFGADAAMSALPNSFEETNFHEPRYQAEGAFTSDYSRVGPYLQRNRLVNNSLNGLFVRVNTPVDGSSQTLTVPGRFDDTDIVHLISDNLLIEGSPGGAFLDTAFPRAEQISGSPSVGGKLLPGSYNYKLTFIDRNGYESIPSSPSASIVLSPGNDAISLAGLPGATGDFVGRKLYRSTPSGTGPYSLVVELDARTSQYLDVGATAGGTLERDRADVAGVTLTPIAGGSLSPGSYNYRLVMVDERGREGLASQATSSVAVQAGEAVQLANLPLTLEGYAGRRIYRSSSTGSTPYVLVAELLDSDSASVVSLTDNGTQLGDVLQPEALGIRRPRLDASLVIDPGMVIKLEAARIETTFGAHIIAEGRDGQPIVFTSKLDDTVGAGGTFDTNNNGFAESARSPRLGRNLHGTHNQSQRGSCALQLWRWCNNARRYLPRFQYHRNSAG
jgi:hypothetical protein